MHPVAGYKSNYMTPHQMKKALQSLEWYLEGYRWPQIKAKGGYSWTEFSFLMVRFPDLSKSYQEARRSSGHSFEDKALGLAEELTAANEFSGSQVQAHKAAMEQYRWSASRRNPAEYAEAGAKQISVVVPIQINSSLDLADGHSESQKAETSVWEVQAQVLQQTAEGPQESVELSEASEGPQEAKTLSSGLPEPLRDLQKRLGLPDEVPAALKKRPSPGRPRKRHKDANRTSLSRTHVLKKAARMPVVARALGLDQPNEPIEPNGDKLPDPKSVSGPSKR